MPWTQLGIDCITNLPPTDEGYDTIVTAINYISQWPEAKSLRSKFAEGVAKFMYELIYHHGAAKIHISDQGREFVNQVCVNSCLYTVFLYIFSEKVWRKNPLWNTKQKSLKKGPKWYGPYEVAERKDGGNGNYLLIAVSGKTRAKSPRNPTLQTTSRGSSTETQRFLMIVILNMDLTTRTVSQLHKRVV